MNDDLEPARIASKNPFPVKNAELETNPQAKKFGIDSAKAPARWMVH
jgi:hypothetical protein